MTFQDLLNKTDLSVISATIKRYNRQIESLPKNDKKRIVLAEKMTPYVERYAQLRGELPE